MAGDVFEINDANFQSEVLASEQPVLVDFSAEWCVPCKMLTPRLEALATEFRGKARVGKLDVEKSPNTATEYRISSLPTVMVFHRGIPGKPSIGLVEKSKLADLLNAALAEPTAPAAPAQVG